MPCASPWLGCYWNEALAINITAPFLCAREAVRIMKAQQPQGGRIVNIGSVSAKTPRPDSLPYTVTKFGLQGMTHLTIIVSVLAGYGLTVILRSNNPKDRMSALGQKRTSTSAWAMSALPPKADIAESDWDVRFVPKADIAPPH